MSDDNHLATLVANHRDFLAFVQRRVGGNRALAEDIVQDALVKSIDKLDSVEESAVGWFYRVLRNAIIDHHRHAQSVARRTDALAREPVADNDEELHQIACQCVRQLAKTLKPEYAQALERIELDDVAVQDYAKEAGITASNAGVRIFRAREALRRQVAKACGTCAEHGCLDCTCNAAPPSAS